MSALIESFTSLFHSIRFKFDSIKPHSHSGSFQTVPICCCCCCCCCSLQTRNECIIPDWIRISRRQTIATPVNKFMNYEWIFGNCFIKSHLLSFLSLSLSLSLFASFLTPAASDFFPLPVSFSFSFALFVNQLKISGNYQISAPTGTKSASYTVDSTQIPILIQRVPDSITDPKPLDQSTRCSTLHFTRKLNNCSEEGGERRILRSFTSIFNSFHSSSIKHPSSPHLNKYGSGVSTSGEKRCHWYNKKWISVGDAT